MIRSKELLNRIGSFFYRVNEEKLFTYNGYQKNRLYNWKKESKLNWKITSKILNKLKIVTAIEIREYIKEFINNNPEIFDQDNVFITSFGQRGKSGDVILYEFNHCAPKSLRKKVIESWEIEGLPPNSTIVFLDDIVGTGQQSVEYINGKLNLMLKSSHICYLFCICATNEGIERFNSETNFEMINAFLLTEDYEFLNPSNKTFSEYEKEVLITLNDKLTPKYGNDYNKGLLIAFPYAIPNNTMPIIWKEGFKYDTNNKDRKWYALLPRSF